MIGSFPSDLQPRLRLREPAVRLAALVGLVGLLATSVIGAWVWVSDDATARERLVTQPAAVVESTNEALTGVLDKLQAVTAFFRASRQVTQGEFEQFASDVGLTSGMNGLGFAPVLTRGQLLTWSGPAGPYEPVDVYEFDEEGLSGPVADRIFYYPVLYLWPGGDFTDFVGFDLASEAAIASDVRMAHVSGNHVASALFALPGVNDDDHFVVLHPIHDPGTGHIQGVATALMDAEDLIESNIPDGLKPYVEWDMVDVTGTPAETSSSASVLRFGGRSWVITVTPRPGSPFLPSREVLVVVVLVGVAASGLAAASVYLRRKRREAAHELVAARALAESKDRFIASVSHELRTPLTGVIGFAEILAGEDDGGPDERREMLGAITEQAIDISYIIDDLLVAAKGEIGEVSIFPEMVGVDDEVAGIIATGPYAAVAVDLAAGMTLTAHADRRRFRQIVRNLLENARLHGGDDVRLRARPDGEMVRIEVWDDGPGVPDEGCDRLFEMYAHFDHRAGQTDSLGIGLSVSRLLARAMGGDLVYERRDGWTVFCLTLPSTRRAPAPRPASALSRN